MARKGHCFFYEIDKNIYFKKLINIFFVCIAMRGGFFTKQERITIQTSKFIK
jgi:hypothetical protein